MEAGRPRWPGGEEAACDAGDTGAIPPLGRSQAPQSSLAPAPRLRSLGSTTREATPGRHPCPAARGKARRPHRRSTAKNRCYEDDQFYQIKVNSPFYQKVLINDVSRQASKGDGVAQRGLWFSKHEEGLRRGRSQSGVPQSENTGAAGRAERRSARCGPATASPHAAAQVGGPAGGSQVWALLRGGASAAAADSFQSCLGLPQKQGRCLVFPSRRALSSFL